MPTKDLHEDVFDEGTIAKLDIFESYLKAWLPVFIHTRYTSMVNICDFFAGSGTDKIGNHGSPLLILKIIEEYQSSIQKNQLRVNIILNEFVKQKYENLKVILERKIHENPIFQDLVTIDLYNEDFSKLFKKITPSIRDDANLIFLDQNGIKHVKDDVLLKLVSFSKTDFLFFISSAYFNRFPFENHFPTLHQSIDRSKPTNIHREILKYYQSLVPNDNETKLYPFSIKKKGRVYGLIFGSKHCRGVEKFLNVAWKKNTLNGEANFDIDEEYKNKQMSLWGEPKISKLEQFENDLKVYVLSQEELSNKEVLEFTLENGFEPKQAANVLRKMKKKKLIEHFSFPYIGCKQVYTDNKEVYFKRKS